MRDRFLGCPVRRDDERDVFVVSKLVQFCRLLRQRPILVRHFEPAAGADEFAGGIGHDSGPDATIGYEHLRAGGVLVIGS